MIHILSLTGATAFSNPPYTDTYDITKAPTTVTYPGAFAGGFIIFAKVNNLDKQGHSVPVVLKAAIDLYNDTGDGNTPPYVHETCTYVLPVSEVANLQVAANVVTQTTGEVHPGETALYQFTTTAAGADMDSLVFKAQLPKGATLVSLYPGDGVQSGSVVTWKPTGTQSSFAAGFSVKVKYRPGTARLTSVYGGAAKVQSYLRTAQATSKTPIKSIEDGLLTYYTNTGPNGPVAVDQTYTYVLSNWDWAAGDVAVSLDDNFLATIDSSAPYGSFEVPVFKDPDLEEVLSAKQTDHPVDTIVTGEVDAKAELVTGQVVMVTAASEIARKLHDGSKVATGEVVTTDTTFPDQLGHLRLDGTSSGVVLAYAARPTLGSDGRLIFARGGDVAVYGGVRAHKIKIGTATQAYTAQDFTAYDVSHKNGVLTLGPTISSDTTVYGYIYRPGDLLITANVNFNGSIWFVTGNVTITGSITGQGSLICQGNVTVMNPGKLQILTPATLTLGVGGTLTIAP
ncbi:MAG: hypothetical protein QM796_07030 [Chthoniobacteraceae bacterium]